MHILITTDVIHAGGAETFVLRLAQALHNEGYRVLLYPLYKKRIDKHILNTLAPDVPVLPAKLFATRLLQVGDGVLRRLRIDFSIINFLLARHLAAVVKQKGIDVIHSHLFTADTVAVLAGKKTKLPVITTMHGDYSAYSRDDKEGRQHRFLHFPAKMKAVLEQMAAVVCICEEHISFLEQYKPLLRKVPPLYKIYNGFDVPHLTEAQQVKRSDLGIPDSAFVFCMVARGIPEKGWEEAIAAFKKLNRPDAFLLLIGSSQYVQSLQGQHSHAAISFLGLQQQPFRYLRIADAGLFCSKIKTEALPTVIIEYLAAGLPVISTKVGEAERMLQGAKGSAGILVDAPDAQLPTKLQEAMSTLLNDKQVYEAAKLQTASAFAKFGMEDCTHAYKSIYCLCKKD